MLKIFLLGIISGFPWVLIGSCLTLWLKEEGLSRSSIGWAGLIFSIYAINYLWAPFIDKLKIPYLTGKIGHRKSWIFVMQTIIGISLLFWTFIDPDQQLYLTILVGLIIAISSATQDITIDALRIEQIGIHEKNSMAAGASIAVIGWWTGYKIGGFYALFISDIFENLGYANYWKITFIFLIFLIVLFNILLLFLKETSFSDKEKEHKKLQNKIHSKFFKQGRFSNFLSWFFSTILGPIFIFFKKNGLKIGIALLSFLFLYKIGEAFLGRMSILFYKEIGFSKTDIGIFFKRCWMVNNHLFHINRWFFHNKNWFISFCFYCWHIYGNNKFIFCDSILVREKLFYFPLCCFTR